MRGSLPYEITGYLLTAHGTRAMLTPSDIDLAYLRGGGEVNNEIFVAVDREGSFELILA